MFIDKVFTNVERHITDIAVVDGDIRMSYLELVGRIAWRLDELLEHGVGPGHRVMFLADNTVENVILQYGLHAAGAISVPLDGHSKPHEIRQILDDCRPHHFLIRQISELRTIDAVIRHYPTSLPVIAVHAGIVPKADLSIRARKSGPSAVLTILYTSGSTGRPKGVCFDVDCLINRVDAWVRSMEHTAADRFLCALPFSHAAGMEIHGFPAHYCGAELHVVDAKKITPQKLVDYISREKITFFSMVPEYYQMMASSVNSRTLTSVRRALSHSARLPPSIVASVHAKFGVMLSNEYGMTEIGPTHVNLHNLLDNCHAIGVPLPAVDARVIRDDGSDAEPNETGELMVRSHLTACGYFRDQMMEPIPRDEWFSTGDIVYMDNTDNYYYVTRKDDLLNIHGTKVYPEEIRRTIKEMANVVDCHVLGHKEPYRTAIYAFVVRSDAGITEDEIISWCRHRLSDYKAPSRIFFIDKIPTTSLGKPRVPEIRRLLEETLAAETVDQKD